MPNERLQRHIDKLQKQIRKVSSYRLWAFLITLTLSVIAFQSLGSLLSVTVLLAGMIAFFWLVKEHQKLDDTLDTFRFYLALRNEQIARYSLDWENIRATAPHEYETDHPFETDLVITGSRSLLQLLNQTTSIEGEEALRKCLLRTNPSEEDAIKKQQIVQELAALNHFRERLLLTAHKNLSTKHPRLDLESLQSWITRRNAQYQSLGTKVAIASSFSLLTLALIILDIANLLAAWWIVGLIANYLIGTIFARDVANLMGDAEKVNTQLKAFGAILTFIEKAKIRKAPKLEEALAAIRSKEPAPSNLLDKLSVIANKAALTQGNAIVGFLLNLLMPWDLYYSWRLNQYTERLNQRLPEWVNSYVNLEVYISMASFAALNNDYSYPIFQNSENQLEAVDLGHPLLPRKDKVTNSFSIADVQETVLLTGSNMSGKSTFLRTIGVNMVLAYAGAPVNATKFSFRPMRLYTCINVSDSLADGFSYFYAEVRRLRMLLENVRNQASKPILYLIDEIFRGTNNRERLLGSTAYVEALSKEKACGLVSTHDLELVKLEKKIPHLHNYHFRETIKDGLMKFEYKLLSGPSPTTNALRIMQMEGLPTPNLDTNEL